jgi:hypothetical protein
MSVELDVSEIGFNPHAVALVWERANELPVSVAATLAQEFANAEIHATDGEQSDRDVLFTDANVLVEEKAVGVCGRERAEYAPGFIELDRDDGRVLAVNPNQIFEGHQAHEQPPNNEDGE